MIYVKRDSLQALSMHIVNERDTEHPTTLCGRNAYGMKRVPPNQSYHLCEQCRVAAGNKGIPLS